MDLGEVLQIKETLGIPVTLDSVYEFDNHLVINKFVALQVKHCSNSYDNNSPISISLSGIEIGYLIFLKDKGGIEISSMTEFQFICFLSEADIEAFNETSFQFLTDYLIIKEEYFIDYREDYKNTSMLWGGFVHELPTGAPSIRHKSVISNIEIGDKLTDLDPYSFESCIRAIEQPYPFERFLKLYHLLELQFDYFVVSKIKALSIPADSNRIGKILNDYSTKELERLTDLIESKCTDIAKLASLLSRVSAFSTIAEEMFINFGKSKNNIHLTNLLNFRAVLSSGSFSQSNLRSLKVPATKDYNKFIINVTSYWIYRIRCTIAHNKIGEYHLSWTNEAFIVDFGEPLIKEVLVQFFKK